MDGFSIKCGLELPVILALAQAIIYEGEPVFICARGRLSPLEMSTRIFPGGKGDRCVGLTTLPP
jgi:hypothetical protein